MCKQYLFATDITEFIVLEWESTYERKHVKDPYQYQAISCTNVDL